MVALFAAPYLPQRRRSIQLFSFEGLYPKPPNPKPYLLSPLLLRPLALGSAVPPGSPVHTPQLPHVPQVRLRAHSRGPCFQPSINLSDNLNTAIVGGLDILVYGCPGPPREQSTLYSPCVRLSLKPQLKQPLNFHVSPRPPKR